MKLCRARDLGVPQLTTERWKGYRETMSRTMQILFAALCWGGGVKLQRNVRYEGGGESRPRQCLGLWGEAGGEGVLAALGLGGQPR